MLTNELLYVFSDSIISLYGYLIKHYKEIPLSQHLLLRTLAFLTVSIIFNNNHISFISKESILLSSVNFASILGIYMGFKYMDLGITNSLFYSWPIFLYILSTPFLNNKFNINELFYILILFIAGILILYQKNNSKNIYYGLIGVIISILTHIFTIIYYKNQSPNIHEYILNQYSFALIPLLLYVLFFTSYNITYIKDYFYIYLFSILVGYLGFYLNFYYLKDLSPFRISILTFITIGFSFLLGWFAFSETTNIIQWIGILIILLTNYTIQKN